MTDLRILTAVMFCSAFGGADISDNISTLSSHTDILHIKEHFSDSDDFYKKSDIYKLDQLYKKIEWCGTEDVWLISTRTGFEFSVKAYCDMKSCDNPLCIEHRGKKFVKEHIAKIIDIQKSMRNPVSWVFTDSLLPYPIDRGYVRKRFKLLSALLKKYSKTKYSIHMEIKLHDVDCYLHFHVLSGGISDLSEVRRLWDRQIKYEFAVHPKHIAEYVAKYASKTPFFHSDLHRQFYHLAVYKLIMHRFGTKVKENKVESEFQLLRSLYAEINRALRKNPFNWISTDYGKLFIGNFLEYKDPEVDT